MGKRYPGNIVLTGFSYTGKTQVSQIVARRLGWALVDTDEEIVKLAGKPIPEIFAQDGEDHFRKLERQALLGVCKGSETVISTGGGIIMDPENRRIMREAGVVVCLEAEPETIHNRLMIDSERSGEKVIRPLLQVEDPLGRIRSLKESRQLNYDKAHWTVRTDCLTPDEVATEVIRGWDHVSRKSFKWADDRDLACVVTTAIESYPVYVGWGILDSLGERMVSAGLGGVAYVFSDDQVYPHYGERVATALRNSGFTVDSLVVTHGEPSKSLAVASRMYDFLVLHRAERSHVIVALGGGVVGDLAGFVAATFLRGMPLVQVPTSLMAMVDSSIGGKVAVNHPDGKNLIGAFYQPRMVLADVEALMTLPRRELVSGWAEVVKHGLIRDADYFHFLEEHADGLAALDQDVSTSAIRRSAAIKAEVVSQDEKEAGLRTILNYGHTIAHGLETATGYEQLLHGEAVAVGMTGAALISQQLGLLGEKAVERQRRVLEVLGLPTAQPGADAAAILRAMELDKKTLGMAVRWVLLERIGHATIRKDVSMDIVRDVVMQLVRTG